MRANEFVIEVFAPGKKNWEWARLGTNEVSAFFKVGGREYLWQAFTGVSNPKKWEIQFRLIRKPDVDDDDLDLFGKTGTGNSAEVMSTAVDITRAFLKEYGLDRVEEITFNAKDDPKFGATEKTNDPRSHTRASLYAKMIKRLLPGWDLYSKKDSVDGMVFSLTDRRAYDKPENKISERNNGNRWVGNEIYRDIGDEGIDEGVVDWAKKGAAAGAIALGALGAGNADAKIKPIQPTQKSAIVQPAKNQAPEEFNALSNNIGNEVTLQRAAKKAGIKGTELAQFLAQMKHESWDFERMKEKPQPGVKDYYAKRYDMKYSPKTAKILGNKHVGDGARYHGRGFVQLTGRDNYRMASDALGIDLLKNPDLASKPEVAAKIAVWYWQTRVKPGIKNFADTNAVTQKINPAMRGVEDRHANFKNYMRII